VISPVVPQIADKTGAGPAVMGLLVTMFAVGQLVGYPLAGRGIQERHAAWVLGVALGCMALGDLGFVLGGGLAVYFPARLLMGIGAGGLWLGVAFAVLERFPGEEYRRMTGVLASYSVGSVVGPLLGAIGGIRPPFLAHLGLVALAAVVVARLGMPAERPAFGSDRSALRSSGFRLASAMIILVALTLGTLEGPLPIHFATHLSQAEIGALYVGTALTLGLGSIVGGWFPPRAMIAVGAAAVVFGIALAGAVGSVPLWALAAAIAGLAFGVGESGALGVLLETIGTERIVLAMVVWSQFWAIGYLAGPAAGGAIADVAGFRYIGVVPFVFAVPVAFALARDLLGQATLSPSSTSRSRL
jgi:MFS family permease